MKPIINPQTLTEEQGKIIKDEYVYNTQRAEDDSPMLEWYLANIQILEWLFGKEFFEK